MYINVYSLRNFYALNYYLLFFYYFVGRNKEVGGLDIKYFFGNKSIFLEKVLYTQLVFRFILLFCWGIWGLDIKYFLYIIVYFLRNLYTPKYYLFVFCWFLFGGVGRLDITYWLYIDMYSLRNVYALNYYLTFVYFLEVEGAGVTGLDI